MSALIDSIRKSVIGDRHSIATPFGKKPLVYADYTASGRALEFIEEYIQHQVLPFYANTHTETSYTGAQTTAFREQARAEIRRAVNAGDEDRVIFCGSGATAAISKLIDILNLRLPADLSKRYALLEQIPPEERPVVFIGPYEHHSNELPWRESIAELVVIPLDSDGMMDVEVLEEKLQLYKDRSLKIGSFSAASNVTGIKTDVDVVARLLHRYNALSFWDYAAAGPYIGIDMAGSVGKIGDSSKDAIFLSPHKFIGGPGTPGVLVAKQQLLQNSVPVVPGGGSVVYVTPEDHRYIDSAERREEAGTPAIVESIRAGLVFKLQQAVGTREIERREKDFIRRATERWNENKNIKILGNNAAPRLSIVSFLIKYKDKDLHYSFIAALLNDLFGIQARGGCSCAGPYGHTLLGMDMAYSKSLEHQLLQNQMILRPGWVRLNFNYFIDENTFEYLLQAVELVADHGWRFLPFYKFDEANGVWRYQNQKNEPAINLGEFDFVGSNCIKDELRDQELLSLPGYLALAEEELRSEKLKGDTYSLTLSEAAETLRWFVLPQEILEGNRY